MAGDRRRDDDTTDDGPTDATPSVVRGRAGRATVRERALGALTFFYGSADHRDLPDDDRRSTGRAGEDVGDGWRRRGEPGRQYVTRDDDPR